MDDIQKYNEISRSYETRILTITKIIILLMMIIEFLTCIAYDMTAMITESRAEFYINYFLRPTLINIVLYFITTCIYKTKKIPNKWRTLLPIYVLMIVFANMSITHRVFIVLFGIMIVPLFISTIYFDSDIEKNIFLTSLLMNVFIFVINYIKEKDVMDMESFVLNAIISFSILFFTHKISQIVVKVGQEKEKELIYKVAYGKQLKEKVVTDALTKLYNHTYYFDKLNEFIKEKKNNETIKNLYVGVIDIDFFKNVNDMYGHEVGNIVLVTIANILKKMRTKMLL